MAFSVILKLSTKYHDLLTYSLTYRECIGSRDTHLPDTTEVSQVEDVVKLGRRRKHLHLGALPELACRRNQLLNVLLERLDKATLLNDREQQSVPPLSLSLGHSIA